MVKGGTELCVPAEIQSSRKQTRSETSIGAKTNPTETLLKRKKCKEVLVQIEEERIRKALAETNGSVTHADPLIGVTCPGLIYIIKSLPRA